MPQSLLARAVERGHEEILQMLLLNGSNMGMKCAGGRTELLYAASCGDPAILKRLLTKSADADAEARDDRGWTALHHATNRGDLAIVNLLLGRGASIEARTNGNETALYKAIEGKHEKVVAVLLEHGACTDTTSSTLNTTVPCGSQEGTRVETAMGLCCGCY